MSADEPPGGLAQDLAQFTVQVLHRSGVGVVGAGCLIGRNVVVTCAHVAIEAGAELRAGAAEPTRMNGPSVAIQLLSGGGWKGRAYPICWLYGRWPKQGKGGGTGRRVERADVETWYDDVAVLRILGEPPPADIYPVAALGRARPEAGHSFRATGFPRRSGGRLFYIDGEITGRNPGSSTTPLRYGLLQLKSTQIVKGGMSGGPVLDETLNRVVGIIESSWFDARPGFAVVRPLLDSGVAWAVDSDVLSSPPFSPYLRPVPTGPLARQQTPRPSVPEAEVRAAIKGPRGDRYPAGGASEEEGLVPREELYQSLLGELEDPERRVLGLIGFGGEGKTTLGLQLIRKRKRLRQSQVFWWDFRMDGGPDLFFAKAVHFFTDGRLHLGPEPSPTTHMDALSMVAVVQPCLFVLDGVEVVQQRDTGGFGRITHDDLRLFLLRLASTRHDSFCLLTSRLQFRDLPRAHSRAYAERKVGRLTLEEGKALLVKRKVRGGPADLGALVEAWDGHALTLSLLGEFIADEWAGDMARAVSLGGTLTSQDRAAEGWTPEERLSVLLRFYDSWLTKWERTVLTVLSAFRTSVGEGWLSGVLQDAELAEAPDAATLHQCLDHLASLALLRLTGRGQALTLHPLVRNHYRHKLRDWPESGRSRLHRCIADRYRGAAGMVSEHADLEELIPLVESVYHLCRAGHFQDALHIYREELERGTTMRLSYQLNAYDTVSALLDSFWPAGFKASHDPALPTGRDARYVVNRKAVALMNTGHLAPSALLFERAVEMGERAGDVLGATQSVENLAEVSLYAGKLDHMEDAARRALSLACGLESPEREEEIRDSNCHLGLALALTGRNAEAAQCFETAERLQRDLTPQTPFLTDIWGLSDAEFLRRIGRRDKARALTEANLRFAKDTGLADTISICCRILGQLEYDAGRKQRARDLLTEAVDRARRISERTVLLEALSARGRCSAESGNTKSALTDLDEAEDDARAGGYALYALDIQISRARCRIWFEEYLEAAEELQQCRREAMRLRYTWGTADAAHMERVLSEAAN
ncbi:trypsin-like peptidase domain-containing protein [Streptomyces lunaelactis]|uniref:trypsin-like peptidase domain-containing protein n=1 Tax=Streptomyces lunaelactis TaxID=1535768 RepID=UPI001584A602|nr:trypsin-like peptidase domain-containing protein [Streptomyces lunaelactis]